MTLIPFCSLRRSHSSGQQIGLSSQTFPESCTKRTVSLSVFLCSFPVPEDHSWKKGWEKTSRKLTHRAVAIGNSLILLLSALLPSSSHPQGCFVENWLPVTWSCVVRAVGPFPQAKPSGWSSSSSSNFQKVIIASMAQLLFSHSLHIYIALLVGWASLVAQMVKNLPATQETLVQSLGWEDPLETEWQHTAVFFIGEYLGQRSLATLYEAYKRSPLWKVCWDVRKTPKLCAYRSKYIYIYVCVCVCVCVCIYISSVQSFSRVRLFVTPWIAAAQASLSITNSRSSRKLMSI